ncbi:MAG: EscU/YscU/HrcU family type III secretion system export apparatus switch protein [Acidobacteria bacterium]|nr:EscU/YscU/HrcU family type III secretion system export apparatus switch protein [Acidobacteriota bacterium]
MAEKTEQPTPKKLEEARKKGQIAMSKDVTTVATFVTGMSLIILWAPRIGEEFRNLFRVVIEAAVRTDGASVGKIWELPLQEAMMSWLIGLAPILGGTVIMGVALAAAQAGLRLSFESMKPDIKKLNPIEGLKKWFSVKGIIEFVKTLIKVVVVVVLGYTVLSGAMEAIVRLHWVDMQGFYRIGIQVARSFIYQVGAAFIVVAAADYGLQRHQWKKGLMMSKDEVKQEYKESEGDPLIKAQRKALGQAMVMQQVALEVPKADAVVTNPTHLAVAIRYDRATMGAPKVTAKGGGVVAKKIVELAKKNDVPIVRDISLAHALFVVEMGRYVPKDLYDAVAEILLFSYRLRQEAQRMPGGV